MYYDVPTNLHFKKKYNHIATTTATMTSQWTPVKRWLSQNKLFAKRGDKKTQKDITHLLLDNGRVSVPNEMNDAFLQKYAETISTGHKAYIVERRTDVFRYCMELDFHSSTMIEDTPAFALMMASYVQTRIVSRYLDLAQVNISPSVLVSYCPCVQENENGEEPKYKTGIHLNWMLPIKDTTALVLWSLLVDMITTDTPQMPHMVVPWSEIVDPAIYEHCGLRMLYSRKSVPCTTCGGASYKRKKTADAVSSSVSTCSTCLGTGKLDMGRTYVVMGIVKLDGTMDAELSQRAKDDVLFAVQMSSIRICEDNVVPVELSKTNVLPDALSHANEVIDKKNKGKRKRTVARVQTVDTNVVSKFLGNDNEKIPMDDLPEDDARFACIRNFIAENFEHSPEVAYIMVMNPKKCPRNTPKEQRMEPFYIASSRSKYCANKAGEHHTAFVYFVISIGGAIQKCFSRKSTIYQPSNKTCEDYKSEPKKLDRRTTAVLFSKKISKKKKEAEFFNAVLFGQSEPLNANEGIDPQKKKKKKSNAKTPPASFMIPNNMGEFQYLTSLKMTVKGSSRY